MRLSRLVLAAAIAAASGAMVFAPAVNAADTGTITINGKVISQTCDVTGGAGTDSAATNFAVTLPVVNTSALAAANDVAGKTDFSLALTNCPTSPTITVGAKFYSASNPVDAKGNLTNTATTAAASNVGIQVLDGSGKPIVLTSALSSATNTDSKTAIDNGAATLDYAAQYIATGVATAGNVKATVTYQITYE